MMRVLVTWGTQRGGTEGIARIVADELARRGFDTIVLPADEAAKASGFDAVIVGGALYAGLWHRAARRFVRRKQKELRRVPVWFFSSGPLDDSSEHETIAPMPQVSMLMERVGALGHATFGGRLLPDARGFPASAMAKKHAGDWRNEAQIRAWADAVADALPFAKPGTPTVQPGGSIARLALHGVIGWAACAAIMGVLLAIASLGVALAVHAVAAPIVFVFVARHYFGQRGARGPLTTAIAFTGIVGLLDLVVVAALIERSFVMFQSVAGTWPPFALILGVTWAVGESIWIGPPPKAAHA